MPTSGLQNGATLAAVDLGSNSFHLVVARYEDGAITIIDRMREQVSLAFGLRNDGTLSAEKQRQALSVLAQFGQRLRQLPDDRVRAVATNAVRRLKSPQAFLMTAETALGHPIEVVSGREEARLIYQGVAQALPQTKSRRLVVDIGGGSTEFIIGQGNQALETESIQVGCIASTMRYFPDGKITRKRWQDGLAEIETELQQFAPLYLQRGWSQSYGSSGTAKALAGAAVLNSGREPIINLELLENLREQLIAAAHVDNVRIAGINADRQAVIAGGALIMQAIFHALQLKQMQVCEAAMREGVLFDLLGRVEQRDPREQSIAGLMRRHAVDLAQASRVQNTAKTLIEQVAQSWSLDEEMQSFVHWAAAVHEIGLSVAHSQYHNHGAYLLEHSDLPGFSKGEQQLLAFLVKAHRRGAAHSILKQLPTRLSLPAARASALLRLAAVLNRNRSNDPLPQIIIEATDDQLRIGIDPIWLSAHPLTRLDLERERKALKDYAINLEVIANTQTPSKMIKKTTSPSVS